MKKISIIILSLGLMIISPYQGLSQDLPFANKAGTYKYLEPRPTTQTITGTANVTRWGSILEVTLSAPATITLPTTALNENKKIVINRLDNTGHALTISAYSGQTVDLLNNSVLNTQYGSLTLQQVSATKSREIAHNGTTNATHTGDATGSTSLTLATVNSNVGTFTNSTITVNAKGLVTAASTGSAAGAETDPVVNAINGLVKSDGATIGPVVSGTDIKTINGASILGSGNITTGDALVSNPLSQFAPSTSTQLLGNLTDEVGSGFSVFNASPNFTGLIGIGTTAPTHSLTFNSTSTGIGLYETSDQTLNYSRLRAYQSGGTYYINTESAGSAILRSLVLGNSSSIFAIRGAVSSLNGWFTFARSANSGQTSVGVNGGYLGTSGTAYGFAINGTSTQAGSAGYTAQIISIYESTVGTGPKWLIDAGLNSAASMSGTHNQKFGVSSIGKMSIATGTNASVDTGTFTGGTVTINNTAVTASSKIFIQYTSCSSCGTTYIGTITAGTSFVVTSSNGSDASTFNYWIIN
jgi:hypothetical protein